MPAASKGCLLEAFKYVKRINRHPLDVAGAASQFFLKLRTEVGLATQGGASHTWHEAQRAEEQLGKWVVGWLMNLMNMRTCDF